MKEERGEKRAQRRKSFFGEDREGSRSLCPRRALEEETFELDLEKQASVSLGWGGSGRERERSSSNIGRAHAFAHHTAAQVRHLATQGPPK